MAEEDLGKIGGMVVQIFHSVNRGGFLLLPLECAKCDGSCYPITPRAHHQKPEREYIQSIGNKECKRRKCGTDSD
jgi:hypothetical protein